MRSFVLLSLVLGWAGGWTALLPRVETLRVSNGPSAGPRPQHLRWSEPASDLTEAAIQLEVRSFLLGSRRVRLVSEGCWRRPNDPEPTCGGPLGTVISLDGGTQIVPLLISPYQGKYTLSVLADPLDPFFACGALGLLVLGVLFLLKAPVLADLSTTPRCLLSLWLVVSIGYLAITPGVLRGHDVAGHLDHLALVRSGVWLPRATSCWQCLQPPLYYWWSAAALWLDAPVIDLGSLLRLQLLSLAAMGVFLVYGMRSLALWIERGRELVLASALLALWPTVIFHGVRIGNEPVFYALCAVCFHAIASWRCRAESVWFYRAAAAATASVWCKATGFLCFVSLALAFLTAPSELRKPIRWRAFAVVLSGLGLGMLPLWWKGQLGDRLHQLPSTQLLQTRWYQSFGFDLADYLSTPFFDNYSDAGGRAYWLNAVAKTALFSDMRFGDALKLPALLLAVALTGLLLVALPTITKTLRRPTGDAWLGAWVATWLAALAAYRLRVPYASAENFRFVFPVLIPSIAWIFRYKASRSLSAVISLFIGASLIFFACLFASHALHR